MKLSEVAAAPDAPPAPKLKLSDIQPAPKLKLSQVSTGSIDAAQRRQEQASYQMPQRSLTSGTGAGDNEIDPLTGFPKSFVQGQGVDPGAVGAAAKGFVRGTGSIVSDTLGYLARAGGQDPMMGAAPMSGDQAADKLEAAANKALDAAGLKLPTEGRAGAAGQVGEQLGGIFGPGAAEKTAGAALKVGRRILRPAVKTAEGIKVGKIGDNHDTIIPNAPEKDRGFVDQNGQFLDRQQAAAARPDLDVNKDGGLTSEEINVSHGLPERKSEAFTPSQLKKLSEVQGTAEPRGLQERDAWVEQRLKEQDTAAAEKAMPFPKVSLSDVPETGGQQAFILGRDGALHDVTEASNAAGGGHQAAIGEMANHEGVKLSSTREGGKPVLNEGETYIDDYQGQRGFINVTRYGESLGFNIVEGVTPAQFNKLRQVIKKLGSGAEDSVSFEINDRQGNTLLHTQDINDLRKYIKTPKEPAKPSTAGLAARRDELRAEWDKQHGTPQKALTPSQLKAEAEKPTSAFAAEKPSPAAEKPAPKSDIEFHKSAAEEGPLTEAPAIDNNRRMEDQLFQIRNLETSDRIEAMKRADSLPDDYSPELDEKLYHHEEDPTGVPLTEAEQKVYDEHVAPVRKEANELAAELEKLSGVKPDLNDIYTPRYVAGKTKSYGESLRQWMNGVTARLGGASTRTMRKTVDAQKGRRFFLAENPEGEKVVVFAAPNRDVVAFDGSPDSKKFGRLAGSGGAGTGSKVSGPGGTWTLSQATTKQIEDVTRIRYVKSVMANRLDNLAKLRAAVRNARFIEEMKSLPRFGDYFIDANATPVPPRAAPKFGIGQGRAWRRPQLAQFQNYLVEPHLADVLDDFARTSSTPEGINRALQNIGHVMNGIMFINPKAHIDNVFNHMLVGRGLVGNLAHLPEVVRSFVQGAKEVTTLGPEYIRALKSGLSLPYSRIVAGDLHDTLLMRLGKAAESNPTGMNKFAVQLGYPSAAAMVKRWASIPNRILWFSQDAMMMSRVLELKKRGIPLQGAIREAEREIPNYRVPSQVLGSRAIAEIFGNPSFGRFARYQYGRLRAYADSLQHAFRIGNVPLAERAHAFDQLLMLGVYTFGVYSAYDYLWQHITGNPNAETSRAGASSIPYAVEQATEGKKKWWDLVSSLFTLGVPLELAGEAYTGRYGWSGQPIVRDADVRAAAEDPVRMHQVARDVAAYFASKFSTIGQMMNPESRETMGQVGLRALGVQSPTDEQMMSRLKGQRYDEKSARRRAYKQEAR